MARKELPVEPREVTGKKVAALRRSGVLPANIYGRGLDSVSVQVGIDEMNRTLHAATVNEVIDVKIAGESETRPVVIHRIQRHPLSGLPLHADLFQVSLREKMRADVPLVVVGRSEAIETFSGVLVHSLETLHIEALPLDIPTHIEVDITGIDELEMSVHVRDLPIPGNVTVLNDGDLVVVKVAAPRVAEEEEVAVTAEVAEG
ncbi:MAG TPA: 50S ribosomal protein L25, partial [Dehalococcoidia bacterium]|nr:50S ribosomal protein L25 [Dehalococcoidia bacterium]